MAHEVFIDKMPSGKWRVKSGNKSILFQKEADALKTAVLCEQTYKRGWSNKRQHIKNAIEA